MKNIINLGLFLALVAAIAAAALSLVYVYTAPKIDAQQNLEIGHAKKEVLGEQKGKTVTVAPVGYAGPIEMMVGINNNGAVTGIKIIKSIETPGLGLNANDPKFLDQFKGKTRKNKLQAKEDIDALTGATITTQAICDGVKEALSK